MNHEERMALSDRELLIRIDTRLEGVIEDKKDHEVRIRKLEDRRTVSPAQLWTGAGSAVAVATGVVQIIQWAVNR